MRGAGRSGRSRSASRRARDTHRDPRPDPDGVAPRLEADGALGAARYRHGRFEVRLGKRGLARFTFQLLGNKPFFGRVEAEGGQFKTSEARLGSTGADITGRFLAGAATRITSGVVLTAGAGVLTRYEWGRPTGGVPTIGMFGVASNLELDIRLLPAISMGFFVEGAIAPFPYLAQTNLGDLSDSSEFRGRIQFSYDVSPSMAIDVGYDFTRWHAAFTNSTIVNSTDRALLIESRDRLRTCRDLEHILAHRYVLRRELEHLQDVRGKAWIEPVRHLDPEDERARLGRVPLQDRDLSPRRQRRRALPPLQGRGRVDGHARRRDRRVPLPGARPAGSRNKSHPPASAEACRAAPHLPRW